MEENSCLAVNHEITETSNAAFSPAASSLAARRRYSPPRLVDLMGVEDLLEALGPAQAGYGGPGLP